MHWVLTTDPRPEAPMQGMSVHACPIDRYGGIASLSIYCETEFL